MLDRCPLPASGVGHVFYEVRAAALRSTRLSLLSRRQALFVKAVNCFTAVGDAGGVRQLAGFACRGHGWF